MCGLNPLVFDLAPPSGRQHKHCAFASSPCQDNDMYGLNLLVFDPKRDMLVTGERLWGIDVFPSWHGGGACGDGSVPIALLPCLHLCPLAQTPNALLPARPSVV